MEVFHTIWDSSGKFFVWAESSNPLKPPMRLPRSPKPHLFALNRNELIKTITRISPGLISEKMRTEFLTILLPSSQNLPLPSPWLIQEEGYPPKLDKSRLQKWRVPALVLHPDRVIDFLVSLPNRPPPGIEFSDSLYFWAEVAKFSLELIAKESFIPTIYEENQNLKASWKVIINEEDSKRVKILSEVMPPSCRALPQGMPLPSDLLLSFLNQTVDAFIRRTLILTSVLPHKGRTPQEEWLRALLTENDGIKISYKERGSFSKFLTTWLSEIQPGNLDVPFRTCFRLDPPEDGKKWRLGFYLQAKDDPSLLISAYDVWRVGSDMLSFLNQRFEDPQERLLADLGRASRLFPSLEEGLNTSHPVELILNTEGAYDFLKEAAPLLNQSGFGLLLPAWWQRPETKVGVRLKLKPKGAGPSSSGFFGLDAIVDYNWAVALGDRSLSPQEFEKLTSLKVPLIQVRGEWVEVKREDIDKVIGFFKNRHKNQEMILSEAMRLGLGRENPEIGLSVIDIEAEGWLKDVLNRLSGDNKITTLSQPRTFNGRLRPYQVNGLSWLSFLKEFGFGGCLADDMGLGKTIQLLALLLYERKGRRSLGPTLLICPTSIVGNWQRETQRFAPSLKVMVHHGPDRFTHKEFEREAKKNDLVITTYALTHRDEEFISKVNWERVVLDEAQNIKNPSAKQTRAIRRLRANHRVALTGTPVENRLSELWSIMEFLNPGYLKSFRDFRINFAIPIERYRDSQRAQLLKRMIQPFLLRRLKTDPIIIKDLPDKIETKDFCNLTQEQASLYQAVVKEMLEKIEESKGIERKGLVLATLTKLKQVCNHPALFLKDKSSLRNRSGKLIRLLEMLEEVLAEGDKALIFTQFAEMGAILRYQFQESLGCETLFLHGATPKQQRDMMVDRFQDRDSPARLFILSLKAGGLGLNLTAANYVFHFDRWWNPAVENQATDRAFRIGQKRNVQVHKFVCIGTLEERIDQLIEKKKELAESIVGSGEGWITELSTAQLREVFALSQDAVGGE